MCDRAHRITGFGCTGEVCTNSRGEKGQCTVPQRLANCGKVRVRIIHGLTLVIKNSYTYCKSLLALEAKYYYACPQGDKLVGKDHRSSPTATHKEDNQRNTPCFKFVTQRLPYVHATGLANLNTSISQFHNYSTSTTLISPPLYHKTIARNQTYHIQWSTSFMQDFMTNHVNDQFPLTL